MELLWNQEKRRWFKGQWAHILIAISVGNSLGTTTCVRSPKAVFNL